MKKSFLLVSLMTLLFAAASCQKDTAGDVTATADTVKIDPVITRATATNFETGDKIGVTITKNGGATHADNACLTYSETDQAFSGDLKWYAEGGESCDIKAFYPYEATGFPTSFTVASDQTSGAGASDFMAAAKKGVYPQRAAVAMVFKHYLSQLVLNIKNDAGAEIEYVKFEGLKPSADIAVNGDDITVSVKTEAEAAPITAECVTEGLKYRAIVVPQEVALQVKVKIKEGNVLVSDVPSSLIKQGYTYTVKAEVTPDNVKVSLAGEIENWEDGGELNGEQKAEVSFEEHLSDGYIEYDNLTYTVAQFGGKWWMTENFAYVPDNKEVSSTPGDKAGVWYPYSSDGTTCTPLTDAASVKEFGLFYDYYTIFNVSEFTADNCSTFEGKQGICPKGWHVPSRSEYLKMCGAGNKLGDETTAPSDPTALFWDTTLGYGCIKKANEIGWNYTFSGSISNNIYQKGNTTSANCAVEAFVGKHAMSYYASSTSNPNTSSGIKFVAMASTFTSANNHGKLSTMDCVVEKGAAVLRCVRDSE